jgi:4-hydroxybenzoate polyprenyltransferase
MHHQPSAPVFACRKARCEPRPVSISPAPADAPIGNWVDRYAPAKSRPLLRMARFDRPIGWWLLLLPCWWSAALAASAVERSVHFQHLILFLIGAVVMRGAGSVWNDIVDRKLDAQVERTRNRPLPSGQVSVASAAAFATLLSLTGLGVLLQFNWFAVILGLCSLLPVAVYPFMKRVTDHPQAVLGLAFAWGALMGWAALHGEIGLAPLMLYAGAVMWVIGYDTIYALQDIEDDAIVGIRSTARAYGPDAPRLVLLCYLGAVGLIAGALVAASADFPSWAGLAAFGLHLGWQVSKVDVTKPERALTLFRSNRDAGLLLFVGLVVDSLT